MGVIRDSFVIFKNWTDALNELPEEYQLEAYKALMEFACTGVMPINVSKTVKAILVSFSFNMQKTIIKYSASVENGKKGGRPLKAKNPNEPSQNNGYKDSNSNNLEEPKKTQQNPSEPKPNLNVNVNVNDNVNVLTSVSNTHTHAREDFVKIKELCQTHCPVIFKRHEQKPNADHNLGMILDEVMATHSLSEIEEVLKHASKTYYVKAKMQNLDLCWVLDNLDKVKNTPIDEQMVNAPQLSEIPSPTRSYTNEEINARFDSLRAEDI